MAVILVIVMIILVIADQIVKYWAVESLQSVGTMDFIHFGDFKVFDLTYLENRGAIFGSMAGQRWFLVGFTSLVIIAGLIAMFWMLKRSKFMSFAIMLFTAGGIGNLIDRVRFGYVVDMFEFKIFHFAIFNVADICVTFAFIMVIIYMLFIEPKNKKTAVQEKSANE